MGTKVLLLLWLVSLIAAGKRQRSSYRSPQVIDNGASSIPSSASDPAKYDFDWEVKYGYNGENFQHHETRNDQQTEGSYKVKLPDGRVQKVTYYVSKVSGYVAKVTYEGKAAYPEYGRWFRGARVLKSLESEEDEEEEDEDDEDDDDEEEEEERKQGIPADWGYGYKIKRSS